MTMGRGDSVAASGAVSGQQGRGSLEAPANRFEVHHMDTTVVEGIDAPVHTQAPRTTCYTGNFRSILNEVDAPGLPHSYSLNPYQGCEHGCAYCYARDTHNYWGFNTGLDFETRIIVKDNAADLLKKTIAKKNFRVLPLMLAGNTDCYQPIERKKQITRQILAVCLEHGLPVGMITKNALILRDQDLLCALAANNLVHVYLSLTTLQEPLRRIMEPRTATATRRLAVIRTLSQAQVPVGAMLAPIMAGINDTEVPALVQAAAEHGAHAVHKGAFHLRTSIIPVFKNWLRTHFPDRHEAVWKKICAWHNISPQATALPRKTAKQGAAAQLNEQLFRLTRNRYFPQNRLPAFDFSHFQPHAQQRLF